MGNTMISTTLPDEVILKIKKLGYKYNELIISGLTFREKTDGYSERIQQLEQNIEKYRRRMEWIYFNFGDQLSKIEQESGKNEDRNQGFSGRNQAKQRANRSGFGHFEQNHQ